VHAEDRRAVRLEDEVDARVRDDLLAMRRPVAEVPAHDPVALDEMVEIGGRRRAPQGEHAPDRFRAEDAARRRRRLAHRVADSSKTIAAAASTVASMSTDYACINIDDVEDLAAKFGMGEIGEARYLRDDVGADRIGLTFYRMNPGKRTGFGHRHKEAEEMYVVLSGSGRVKVDDEILHLRPRDVVRVAPEAVREFEAGPEGMELLATGTHVEGDGEMLQDWWTGE
jgi:mannose-6-phosphate isomerase-like protein (cupin superfamily)